MPAFDFEGEFVRDCSFLGSNRLVLVELGPGDARFGLTCMNDKYPLIAVLGAEADGTGVFLVESAHRAVDFGAKFRIDYHPSTIGFGEPKRMGDIALVGRKLNLLAKAPANYKVADCYVDLMSGRIARRTNEIQAIISSWSLCLERSGGREPLTVYEHRAHD